MRISIHTELRNAFWETGRFFFSFPPGLVAGWLGGDFWRFAAVALFAQEPYGDKNVFMLQGVTIRVVAVLVAPR